MPVPDHDPVMRGPALAQGIPSHRVALVHDWLVTHRGGEAVLLEMARLFPGARIFTLVCRPDAIHSELLRHPITTSFIQQLPGAPRRFREYLPLFPQAVESWDLSPFQLVLSTSHCVAKGVKTLPGQVHLAYVHTPMRYVWDQLPAYLPHWPGRAAVWEPLARLVTEGLRRWDRTSGQRPTRVLANSGHVARRIQETWGRLARVVYPPVEVGFFAEHPPVERHGFLVVSALVPYKRVALAVQWATRHSYPLTVVGDGPDRPGLERIGGPLVHFLGARQPIQLRAAYHAAEALLFCGVEDFGIVPVEAMAAGCPVIALGQGGALETVVDRGHDRTGVFFEHPTLESLDQAVRSFFHLRAAGFFSRGVLQARAAKFRRERFVSRLTEILRGEGMARP